jgi:hypothetical protein
MNNLLDAPLIDPIETDKDFNTDQPIPTQTHYGKNKLIVVPVIISLLAIVAVLILIFAGGQEQRLVSTPSPVVPSFQNSDPTNTPQPLSPTPGLSPVDQSSNSTMQFYKNTFYGYSYSYPKVLASPGEEIGSIEGMHTGVESLYNYDGNGNKVGFQTEKEAVYRGIILYHTSSRAEYMEPQLNTVTDMTTGGSPYRYEVTLNGEVENSSTPPQIKVLLIFPLTKMSYPLPVEKVDKANFLVVEYLKKVEAKFAPVLNSLKIPTFSE